MSQSTNFRSFQSFAHLASGGAVAAVPAASRTAKRPETFVEQDYLASNPDVAQAVRDGAFVSGWEHFQQFGRREGRRLAPRVSRVLFGLDTQGIGLEVGPSINPVAPKRDGYNVEIVDYLDREGLVRKFSADGAGHMYDHVADIAQRTEQIEEVDHVWSGGSLLAAVGKTAHFDWIVASHVLEHLPDPIAFLLDCAALLKPEGVLSLVIPDQRYCFDRWLPLTTTGAWLDAWLNRCKRPSPGQIFDSVLNASTCGGNLAWSAGVSGEYALMYDGQRARSAFELGRDSEVYTDVHCWRMVPASFRKLISDLQLLSATPFAIRHEFDTEGSEFFVQLHCRETAQGAVSEATERLAQLIRIDEAVRSGG